MSRTALGLIAEIADAIEIHPPRAYSWLGQTFEADDATGDDLVSEIERRLYSDVYLTGCVAAPYVAPSPYRGPWPSAEVREMSRANGGTGSPQPGWTVISATGAEVVVERHGLRVWADRSRIRDGSGPPATGAVVSLLGPKEVVGLPGGFYSVFGDAGRGPDPDEQPVDRFYWDILPAGRAELVRAVTAGFNGSDVPFRLKVLADRRIQRTDAAVLYTAAGHRHAVTGLVAGAWAAVRLHLRPATPAFTLTLAPGLGFAEHPWGAESFGTHRCHLLARALVNADRAGVLNASDGSRSIAGRLQDLGISVEHPWLDGSDPRHAPAPIE